MKKNILFYFAFLLLSQLSTGIYGQETDLLSLAPRPSLGQALALQEFRDQLFGVQQSDSYSRSTFKEKALIKGAIAILDDNLSRVGDARDTIGAIPPRRLYVVYRAKHIGLAAERLDFEEFNEQFQLFVAEYGESKISTLEQQWEVILQVADQLKEAGDFGSKVIESYFLFVLENHGLVAALTNPVFCSHFDIDSDEIDAVEQVAISQASMAVESHNAKFLRGEFSKLFAMFTPGQRDAIESKIGLTIDEAIELFASPDIDTMSELLEFRGNRVPSRSELRRTPALVRRVDPADDEAIARLPDSIHSIGRVNRSPIGLAHKRLYQKSLRPGHAIFNLAFLCMDANSIYRVNGTAITLRQDRLMKGAYQKWQDSFSKSQTAKSFVEQNNQFAIDLENILIDSQCSGFYIASIGWNGGLSSFLLRPDVKKELALTNPQIEKIILFRELAASSARSTAFNSKLLFWKIAKKGLDEGSSQMTDEFFSSLNAKQSIKRTPTRVFVQTGATHWLESKNQGPLPSDVPVVSDGFMNAFISEFKDK